MTDVAVDTLRLRGPASRRLVRVAATTLPAALDRALADVGDVDIDRIHVVLDLDVDDYDDEILAVLWADAIRTSVLPAGRKRRTRLADQPADAPIKPRAAAPADLIAVARGWLQQGGVGARELPTVLLTLGDPDVAAATRAGMTADEWASLVRMLANALDLQTFSPWRREILAGQADPAEPDPAEPDPAEPDPAEPDPAERDGAVQSGALAHSRADVAAEPEQAADDDSENPARDVLARLAPIADVAEPGTDRVVLAELTRAAGLVLVYPWLAEHCRRAEALHPHLDGIDVREAALAAVVDPDDPGLADDLLIGFLAGRRDPNGRADPAARLVRTRVPLTAAREVAESASGVLSSFAALLPGFERSTHSFIRACWIVRWGRLDTDRDPAGLSAATHPLDVLLPLLPYPLGFIKLPWSPALTVRFR